MAMSRRTALGGLLATAAIVGLASPAWAQREGRDGRQDARGAVKSVDAGARSITITSNPQRGPGGVVAGTDETFALAQDVEIVSSSAGGSRSGLYREATLADLVPGTLVSVSLSSDRSKAESIVAEEPQVRGVIQKNVDTAAKTLTISRDGGGGGREQAPTPQTYTLADDVEIAVDDGRGRRFSIRDGQLSDLATGSFVTLWLSLDRKQVRGVLAEGPNVSGVVKSTGAATKTMTVVVRQGGARDGSAGSEERTLAIADNAVILLDDGKGKRLSVKAGTLADIPAGAAVMLKLSPEQSKVMQVRAEGPSIFGLLKAVDASKGTITVGFPARNRTDPPEEKTFVVAKDARITSEGQPSQLANLNPQANGPNVQVRLSLDQSQVQSIIAMQPQAR